MFLKRYKGSDHSFELMINVCCQGRVRSLSLHRDLVFSAVSNSSGLLPGPLVKNEVVGFVCLCSRDSSSLPETKINCLLGSACANCAWFPAAREGLSPVLGGFQSSRLPWASPGVGDVPGAPMGTLCC